MIHEKELESIKQNIQKAQPIVYNDQIVYAVYWSSLTFDNKIKIAFDDEKQITVDLIEFNNQN